MNGSQASFVILPERELFTYVLDLGGDMRRQDNPTLPTSSQAPQRPAADRMAETQRGQHQETPAPAGQRDQQGGAHPSGTAPSGEEAGGFNFGSLVQQLLGAPRLQPIRAVMDSAAQAWERIRGFVGEIGQFFRNWLSRIGRAAADVIRGFAEHGLFGYLRIVLREKLGDELYDIIDPLLGALGNIEERLRDLLARPLPDSPAQFVNWTLDVLRTVLGIGWSGVRELASAVVTVVSRAAAAGGRFINYLVRQGKIGVWRSVRWYWAFGTRYFLAADQYKIQLGGVNTSFREGSVMIDPRNAVAFALWEALRAVPQVQPTHTDQPPEVDEPRNAYWVGSRE